MRLALGPEISTYTRLALNTQRSTCLCFLNAGLDEVSHSISTNNFQYFESNKSKCLVAKDLKPPSGTQRGASPQFSWGVSCRCASRAPISGSTVWWRAQSDGKQSFIFFLYICQWLLASQLPLTRASARARLALFNPVNHQLLEPEQPFWQIQLHLQISFFMLECFQNIFP